MYIYRTTIKMHHTDAAGLLFFASQLQIAHEAYESFLESIDFSLAYLLRESNFILPIVHVEADYLVPLFVGDKIMVKVQTGKIGRSSFSLTYDFTNENDHAVGTVRTIHVAIDKVNKSKVMLPDKLKNALKGKRN